MFKKKFPFQYIILRNKAFLKKKKKTKRDKHLITSTKKQILEKKNYLVN